jgi:hypothetical protein
MTNTLHLSGTHTCRLRGRPMVEERTGYILGPDAPRHASCAQFARALAEGPERFVQRPAPEGWGSE